MSKVWEVIIRGFIQISEEKKKKSIGWKIIGFSNFHDLLLEFVTRLWFIFDITKLANIDINSPKLQIKIIYFLRKNNKELKSCFAVLCSCDEDAWNINCREKWWTGQYSVRRIRRSGIGRK